MSAFNPINRHVTREKSGVALASALWLAVASFVQPATSATTTRAKAEAATETLPSQPMPVTPIVKRDVDVVIVWGFRLRSSLQATRIESIKSGYRELIDKIDCLNNICGFVVAQEGMHWRATNVLRGTESELRERQRGLEREGTTLVIVQPTGARRTVPNF